jgi:lysophospholipase L1-like esterase
MSKSVKFANFILISGIVICIVIIVFVFSISDSRSPASILAYYVITITALFFLVAVLYVCKDETKVNLALLLCSIVVSIYIIEILLSLISLGIVDINRSHPLQNKKMAIAREKGVPFDTRTKLQITMDLRKNALNAYPHVFPANNIGTDGLNYNGTKIYPLGAISNTTTVYCNEESEPVIYETDEHGFRNPKGQYDTDNLDVALIGDSFAQGFCVKNGDDIAGQLRGKNIKVLNLGMGGSGPLIELGILSEYAQPAKPKHVFWLYYEGNDMPNLGWEKTPTLMKYIEKDFLQNLVYRQDIVDNALIADIEDTLANKIKEYVKAEKLISFTEKAKGFVIQTVKLHNLRLKLGVHGNCSFNINPMFKDILVQAKSRTEGWGGQLYFVYLPAYDRYMNNMCRKRMFHLQKDKITAMAKGLNINLLDMTEHFDAQSDPASLFRGHYNAEGYSLVAQKIEEYLSDY